MLPYPHHISINISLTGGYHLVCDFDKQRCHSLRGVVVLRDTVDHSDGIHQTRDVLNHFSLLESIKMI